MKVVKLHSGNHKSATAILNVTLAILTLERAWTSQGRQHIIIDYAKNGNWTASLKNYTEDKLPFEVRDQVKRAYYDFTIAFVQEVETPESDGKPTYIIHIEDKHTYQFVRVCDGKMDIWKKLNKQ